MPTELKFQSGFASEIGLRSRNEDYGAVFAPGDQRGVVAAIADGIGGAPGGREAAELAVRTFIEFYAAASPKLSLAEAAETAIAAANTRILDTGRADRRLSGMGTTFSALILENGAALIVHIGDSRIYRLREATLSRLTEDHNLHAEGFPHILTRSLGTHDRAWPDIEAQDIRDRDRILLCTDGVTGVLNDAQIAGILRSHPIPAAAAKRLAEAALAAGGTDNATALILDVAAAS